MNTTSNTRTISGIIEYRGSIIAAHIPVELLILDTMSYSIACVDSLRAQAIDPDYTQEEREELYARADWLDQWIDCGCQGQVPFAVHICLFVRSGFFPLVVMDHNLENYLDQVLAVSKIVPIEEMQEPKFAIRANTNEAIELWLTDARALKNAKLYPGADIRVVDTTVSDIKDIIASQQTPHILTTVALVA